MAVNATPPHNTALPAVGTHPSDLREAVARVIDPWPFSPLGAEWNTAETQGDRDRALAKADRILTLIAPLGNVGAGGGDRENRLTDQQIIDTIRCILHNLHEVEGWEKNTHLATIHCHAEVLLEDVPPALASLTAPVGGKGSEDQGCSGPEGPPGLASGNSPSPSTSSAAGAVYAISDSADFEPEDHSEGITTWTFMAPADTPVTAGLYELRFVRTLQPIEYAMVTDVLRLAPQTDPTLRDGGAE